MVQRCSDSSSHLYFKLCICPYALLWTATPLLSRGEADWHFLWIMNPYQTVTYLHFLSFLFVLYLSVFLASSSSGVASSLLGHLFSLFLFPLRRETVWRRGSTLGCYHSNCIKELSQYSSIDMCIWSFILPPFASLRLKLTSDENEEAGGTREKTTPVKEYWCLISLQ